MSSEHLQSSKHQDLTKELSHSRLSESSSEVPLGGWKPRDSNSKYLPEIASVLHSRSSYDIYPYRVTMGYHDSAQRYGDVVCLKEPGLTYFLVSTVCVTAGNATGSDEFYVPES